MLTYFLEAYFTLNMLNNYELKSTSQNVQNCCKIFQKPTKHVFAI